MPRSTTSQGASPVMFSPLKTMRPASGRRILVIRRSSVVLPAPLGPIRPTSWSRFSSKLTAFTAVSPPKRFVRPSTVKNASDTALSLRPLCRSYLIFRGGRQVPGVDGYRAHRVGRSRGAPATGDREGRVLALLPADPRPSGGGLPARRGPGPDAGGGERDAPAGRLPAGVQALRHAAAARPLGGAQRAAGTRRRLAHSPAHRQHLGPNAYG